MAPYCGPSCYQIIWRPLTDEGNIAWTNIGPGIEELDNNNQYRTILDLSDMTEWRLVLHVNDPAGVTCAIGAQYSTDGGATWLGLDNGNAGVLSTSTLPCTPDESHLVTGWNSLSATAQSDVWTRIAGTGAGAADDPQFGTLELQFRS